MGENKSGRVMNAYVLCLSDAGLIITIIIIMVITPKKEALSASNVNPF